MCILHLPHNSEPFNLEWHKIDISIQPGTFFFFFGECNDKYSLVINTHLLRFKLILSIFSLKNKGTNTTHQFHKSSQMRYYLFSTRTITYYQKYQIHTPKKRGGGGHNRKLKEQPKVQGS